MSGDVDHGALASSPGVPYGGTVRNHHKGAIVAQRSETPWAVVVTVVASFLGTTAVIVSMMMWSVNRADAMVLRLEERLEEKFDTLTEAVECNGENIEAIQRHLIAGSFDASFNPFPCPPM